MAGILDEVGPATRDVLERYGFDPDLFAQLQEGVRTGRIGHGATRSPARWSRRRTS
jgi:hypothetical protein